MSYFRFQSKARQNEGVIFLLNGKSANFFLALHSLSEEKKQALLEVSHSP